MGSTERRGEEAESRRKSQQSKSQRQSKAAGRHTSRVQSFRRSPRSQRAQHRCAQSCCWRAHPERYAHLVRCSRLYVAVQSSPRRHSASHTDPDTMAFNLLSTFNAAQANVVAGLGLSPLTGGAAPLPLPLSAHPLPAAAEGAARPFSEQQHTSPQQQTTRTGRSDVGLHASVRGLGAPLPPSSRTAVPLPSAAQRAPTAAHPSVLQAGTTTSTQASSVQGSVKLELGVAVRSAVAPALAPNPYAVKTEPVHPPSSSTGGSLSLHAAAGADSAYAAAILASSGAIAPLPSVAAPHAASSSATAAAARPSLPSVSFHAASAAAAPSTVTRRVGGQSLTIGAPSHHVSLHVVASSAAASASNGSAAAASSAARPASSSAPSASVAAGATVTVSAPTTAFNPLVCPECPPGAEVIVGQLLRCR
jgi:hypothetical protein